jgi:hypothetical protein
MKCPKCGYNSFEHQDSCKRCANDLTAYKANFGLKAVVFPHEVRASMAETYKTETALADQTPESAETAGDMFSFDLPPVGSTEEAAPATARDPFNFDEEPVETTPKGLDEFTFSEPAGSQPSEPAEFSFDGPAAAQPQDFADFSFDEAAGSNAQGAGDFNGFDDQKSAQARAEEEAFANLLESSLDDTGFGAPTSSPETAPSGGLGEIDLESFSWDDTPPSAASPEAGAKPDQDLNSPFGGTKDADRK